MKGFLKTVTRQKKNLLNLNIESRRIDRISLLLSVAFVGGKKKKRKKSVDVNKVVPVFLLGVVTGCSKRWWTFM